jgi:hypothetical protein
LIFHLFDLAYGFPDSVFLMGSEYSNLPWNFPFPAFTNSPSFKHADMPWPWIENFSTERLIHEKVVEARKNSVDKYNASFYHEAFAAQFAWSEKIPKAFYRASFIDLRALIFDQALLRPDLIDALWIGGDELDGWNPEVDEDHKALHEKREMWMAMVENDTEKNHPPGTMKALVSAKPFGVPLSTKLIFLAVEAVQERHVPHEPLAVQVPGGRHRPDWR